jgi:hypothetical protein
MRKIKEGKPILGSWTAVYALMVAVLVSLMIFFYFFTKHFA